MIDNTLVGVVICLILFVGFQAARSYWRSRYIDLTSGKDASEE